MDRLLEFSGKSSDLSQDFYPPIELNTQSNYVLGLYSLSTYNSLGNIRGDDENNIIFHMQHEESHEISTMNVDVPTIVNVPAGNYEIEELGNFIKTEAAKFLVDFQLVVHKSTMKVEMSCNATVVLPLSIGKILGFQQNVYTPGSHTSERTPQITSINVINVECNIITGSYRNGKRSLSIYSFYPDIPMGYKLIERPTNLLFLPVHVREISNITLRLTNQEGSLVDFNEEEVTIHLILRELT